MQVFRVPLILFESKNKSSESLLKRKLVRIFAVGHANKKNGTMLTDIDQMARRVSKLTDE